MNAALWFFDHGIGVFPLKPGGKDPACRSWDDYAATRDQVARFHNYGVRLGPCPHGCLGVVDTDNPATEAWAASHLPQTPFMVQTARGRHRYYRLAHPVRPPFIKRDGLVIECRNHGEYVVGPDSVHPSGVIYTAADWSWVWADIPDIHEAFVWDDGSVSSAGSSGEGFELAEAISEGERHYTLFRFIRSLKGLGTHHDEARALVRQANQQRCDPPLREDAAFNQWFERGWRLPDRPFGIPDVPLESRRSMIDVDTPTIEALK